VEYVNIVLNIGHVCLRLLDKSTRETVCYTFRKPVEPPAMSCRQPMEWPAMPCRQLLGLPAIPSESR